MTPCSARMPKRGLGNNGAISTRHVSVDRGRATTRTAELEPTSVGGLGEHGQVLLPLRVIDPEGPSRRRSSPLGPGTRFR